MEFVAHLRLSKQALIDLGFFCGVPIVLAMLSAVLGPYAAIMGGAGAAAYVLSLAIVPWWLTCLTTHLASKRIRRKLPLWLIAAIGAMAAGPFVSLYVYFVNSIAGDIWPALNASLPATFSTGHFKSAALSEGRAVVLWIAFVVIFHETLGWARFAPPAKEANCEDRFQLSGAEWTAEDDALLRSLIGSGKPPRAIAMEMKRTVGGIRARTAKLGLRNNRHGDRSGD
ncbi:hypothetical protein CQ10_18510 [Bradyrhizobium valentinum]|uniref:Uncharacterized protein n=1 Tax=Bradyrhizobium valentinum TaxID=1518501 RepID=A0A0R3LDL9_9BRAD|nr:hypothetical protein CQ10_18510 [Bradyrhizobium valentinum]KRR07835.1 hypothetical protein CP49_07410 [Bradyrhizobium valentinum]